MTNNVSDNAIGMVVPTIMDITPESGSTAWWTWTEVR